jgi:hypothetical protein
MSRSLIRPQFPIAPEDYSQRYMSEIVRQFSLLIQQLQNPGDARHTVITLTNLPTDDVGLEQGSVYNHTGFLKISELDTSSVRGSGLTVTIGTVTVGIS